MKFRFSNCSYNRKHKYIPRVIEPTYYFKSTQDIKVPFFIADDTSWNRVFFRVKSDSGYLYRGKPFSSSQMFLNEEVVSTGKLDIVDNDLERKRRQILECTKMLKNLIKEDQEFCFEHKEFKDLLNLLDKNKEEWLVKIMNL